MNQADSDEAAHLEEMLRRARQLAERCDPLLAGQYALLVGQIEALLGIIRPGPGAEG